MKKFGIALVALLSMAVCAPNMNAQLTKEQVKERKEIKKASKSELNEKASKAAQKEAKKFVKEGWKVTPGTLPLEKQLDRCYLMQMEFDEDMFPKYIMGEGNSVAENYDAAKMQALELAKLNLVSQLQTEITALVNSSVDNQQLSKEQAATITKTLNESKSIIEQSLGRTISGMEAYQSLSNGNSRVLVRLFYSSDLAKDAAKRAIREQLQDESNELRQELDRIL